MMEKKKKPNNPVGEISKPIDKSLFTYFEVTIDYTIKIRNKIGVPKKYDTKDTFLVIETSATNANQLVKDTFEEAYETRSDVNIDIKKCKAIKSSIKGVIINPLYNEK